MSPLPQSWAALPQQITVFMPAINPLQGAGCGFGQPWCHRTSHQLLGTGGGSRAAAQRVWGGSWGAPKPEHPKARASSSPCPLALGWCHPCVLAILFGAWGISASFATGRGGRGAGTNQGTFVPWSRGLGRQGGFCQLQAPQLVSLWWGRWCQPAQRCPCPPRPPPWSCRCPLQGQGVHPSLVPSPSAPCLRQPGQPPWGARVQDLAFLPLGNGGIAQSGWAVTLCFPTGVRQILAGTRSSGARLHPSPGPAIAMASGLPPTTRRRAQPSHHAGTRCPHIPQPVLLPTHPLCAPRLPGTPQDSTCLPMPRHGRTPTRAGSPLNAIPTIAFLQDTGSPQTLPALLGGSRLRGVPPTTSGLQARSGLGGSEGVAVAVGARGRWHPSRPKPLLLFVSRPGAGSGGLSPTQSPALAAGDRDDGGALPLQVGLIFFFFIV